MMRAQVHLQCMNGGGGSQPPGATKPYIIPAPASANDVSIIRITRDHKGDFHFRTDPSNADSDEEDLAWINYSLLSLSLEPLVDHVFVQLPPRSRFAGHYNPDRIAVPASTDGAHHYIHLRDDDTINFREDGLQIHVSIEIPNSSQPSSLPVALPNAASTRTHQDQVQVRSSDTQTPVRSHEAGNDTDSEDEPDLDDMDSHIKTPVKSLPVPIIKETPHANRFDTTIPDAKTFAEMYDASLPDTIDAPFSTAQEPRRDHSQPKTGLRSGDPPTSPTVELDHVPSTIKAASDAGSIDEEGSPFDTGVKPGKKYGRGKDTHATPVPLPVRATIDEWNTFPAPTPVRLGDVPDDGDMEGYDDDIFEHRETAEEPALDEPMSEASLTAMRTSEPLGPAETALETARRSLKRKAELEIQVEEEVEEAVEQEPEVKDEESEEAEDEVEEVVAVKTRTKKRKTSATSTPASDANSRSSATRSKKSRLSQPSRSASVEDTDEAVTATKRNTVSPRVVVKGEASSTPTSTPGSTAFAGKTPKVLLSKDSTLRKSAARWIKDHGSEILDDVKTKRTVFVCVAKESIKTVKVLRSLVLGKHVVTEDWIKDSKKANEFLDPDDYIHPEIGEPLDVERNRLFAGMNLFFTTTLTDKIYMSGWQDIVSLVNEAGASAVSKGSSAEYPKTLGRNPTICFGSDNNDPDVMRLQQQHDCIVFHKSLIPHAIIAGKLDLNDAEFHLPAGGSTKGKKKQ